LLPIDDRARRRLLTFSAILCAIPAFLAPLAARSSFELSAEQAAFNARFVAPRVPVAWNPRPIAIGRDPFIPDDRQDAATDNANPASPGAGGVLGMQVVQGQSIGFPLPSNRDASGMSLQDAAFGVPTVSAIVIGTSARALVEENGRARVIGVGDFIAGSRVIAIDRAGVHLKNNLVFALMEDRP